VKKSSSPAEGGFHLNIITASQQAAFAALGSVIYTPKMNNPLCDLGQYLPVIARSRTPTGSRQPIEAIGASAACVLYLRLAHPCGAVIRAT
jgi:hypothetical protein